MGQKVNPKILRLGVTTQWKNKYFENKLNDLPFYSLKYNEIKNFSHNFFKTNGFFIQELKISYANCAEVHIFISYFSILGLYLQNTNKSININNYAKLCTKDLNKNYNNFNRINSNTENFLNNYLKSLSQFIGKKLNITLTLQQTNKHLKKNHTKKQFINFKKTFLKLQKFKHHSFFIEGLNTLYLCSNIPNSSNILAQFLAMHLKQTKRHNFFLYFVKTVLATFYENSLLNFKGIKIKITGRVNGRPRAKHKIINVGTGVPVLTINSHIDYSESVAFTSNGTLGIKVWICLLNN